MKQRLGLAQALLHDPKLIILDEPTTGLDPQGIKEIRDLILHLSKDKHKTILLSSHILKEVEIIANRMIIINKGTTQIEGKVQDLLSKDNLSTEFEIDDIEKGVEILTNFNQLVTIKEKRNKSIIIETEREIIHQINKQFVENGINVSSIVQSRSLEEDFLKITEGK